MKKNIFYTLFSIGFLVLLLGMSIPMKAQTYGSNLVVNPGFEEATLHWTPGTWNTPPVITTAIYVITGTKTAVYSNPNIDQYGGHSQTIAVTAGSTYKFGFAGRVLDDYGISGGTLTIGSPQRKLTGYVKRDNSLGATLISLDIISGTNTTTSGEFTVPTGVSQVFVQIIKGYGYCYADDVTLQQKRWNITASSNNVALGSVSGGGSAVASGSTVTLTATATASGNRFINWTVGGSIVSTNKAYSFTASADVTVVANFGPVQTTYYVRPSGSSAWGSIGAAADQIITAADAANNFRLAYLADNNVDGTATYYFAAGNYTLSTEYATLTAGKLYGGFSGSESSINLDARATSDLDANGLVEPWEMTNATVIQGRDGLKYAQTGSEERFISLNAGAEANGITFTDYNFKTYGGVIGVGTPAGNPADDADAKKGFMKRCIVRKIKSAIGVVMLANSRSVIDQCLIEDCLGTDSYGAVYINRYGGTISNSVIRNNKATTEGGAIYAGNAIASTNLKAVVKNTLIYNNEATTKGGAISSKSISSSFGGIEIVNSTIVNNKTGATGNASVEFDGSGLIVNSIVVGDNKADLYTTSTSNYVNGVVYGTVGAGSAALNTTNVVSAKATSGMYFSAPTSTVGYLGIVVNTDYTNMRTAKFAINNTASTAVTTTSLSAIPATYSSITTYSTVPTTDITSLTRTANFTLGAYQATDIVANGITKTISQPTTLASLTVAAGGKLTISDGVSVNIGSLTLESDQNITATILDSYSTPTINVTVQQYVERGRNWYVSSPVSASGYGVLNRGNSVVEWNEVTKAWDTKSTGNLVAGKGYIQVANSSQGTTGTVNFSGFTNSGDVLVDVCRTESGSSRGYNLVGNPYPSYLDWSDVIADSENSTAGISTSFWYRTKNTLGAYVFTTHNGTSGEVVGGTTANTTINKFIPPMQAFWIRVNENAGITTHSTILKFKNGMREHGLGDNNKLKAPKVDERIRLRLKLENGTASDETLIYFDTNAANEYDNYDSPKMLNNNSTMPDLYSKAGSERLVINGLKEINDNMELTLGFNLNAASSLKLKASEMSNFADGLRVFLLDKVENTQTELLPESAYNFSTNTATTNNESRFSLLFRTPGITTSVDNATKLNAQVFVNKANQITIIAPEKCNYAIYSAIGQKVNEGIITSHSTLLTSRYAAGMYVVKLLENGNEFVTRIIVK